MARCVQLLQTHQTMADWRQSKPDPSRTSIYKRVNDINYQLKMKTSRAVFSEIQKKAGPFPFTLRALEDERRARMGVQEAVTHGAHFLCATDRDLTNSRSAAPL